jgi:hypothetical protein
MTPSQPTKQPTLRFGALTVLTLTLVGCQTTTTTTTPRKTITHTQTLDQSSTSADKPIDQITPTDPCASQLHDLCHPLLLYYATRHQLPERIEELRQIPGFESAHFICPVSKKPYIYNPIGVQTAGQPARIVLYDPAPSHSGFRWAISIIEPQRESDPLITKVIGLPESHFSLRIPGQK